MKTVDRFSHLMRSMKGYFAETAQCITRFRRNSSGAIALQFGIMLVPLITLSAGVVDVVNILRISDILHHAADAASVGSIAVNSPGTVAATSMSSNGTIAAGQTDATNIWNANRNAAVGYTSLTFTPTVTKTGLTITSSVSYTAVIPTTFLPLIGMSTWTLQGSSYASANLAPYVDFYLLLDNTPSMGIGATTTDINTMVAHTSDQCAFACHDLSAVPNDYYTLAKSLGVQMRIDVVRTATQDLMTTATSMAAMPGEFRAAIYTFGATAATAVPTLVAPLSSNLTLVQTEANAIDVMSVPYQNYNNDMQTDFDGTLAGVNLAITSPGDGSTASAPQKILFFVTDGVADAYYPSTCSQGTLGNGRCEEPINTATCTTIKNRGIKIAVLYTTYYPLPTNGWYVSAVQPWASQIATNMQNCASPGLYFEVSPSQGISAAMSALFLQAIRTVRMTE